MTCCTGRCTLIFITFLQLAFTIFRQVFDFLGFVWIPIVGNFVNIVFVVVGLVGALQYRQKILISYSIWCLIWLGLNILVVCYYLEIGSLSVQSGYLTKWSPNGITWWQEHHILCNSTLVQTCLIRYKGIEVVQASIQCALAFLGFCISAYVTCIYLDDDDSFDFIGGFASDMPTFSTTTGSSTWGARTKKRPLNPAGVTLSTATPPRIQLTPTYASTCA